MPYICYSNHLIHSTHTILFMRYIRTFSISFFDMVIVVMEELMPTADYCPYHFLFIGICLLISFPPPFRFHTRDNACFRFLECGVIGWLQPRRKEF